MLDVVGTLTLNFPGFRSLENTPLFIMNYSWLQIFHYSNTKQSKTPCITFNLMSQSSVLKKPWIKRSGLWGGEGGSVRESPVTLSRSCLFSLVAEARSVWGSITNCPGQPEWVIFSGERGRTSKDRIHAQALMCKLRLGGGWQNGLGDLSQNK